MYPNCRLKGIAFRLKAKAPMQLTQESMITRVAGVDGDARGKPGKRQVTILSEEQWLATCNSLYTTLPWTVRRANLLLSGLQFDSSFVGKQIKIGQLILLVTGETDPCHKMDRQFQGLNHALKSDWRGGICCKVLADGRVSVGDLVEVI
jgi:MOSC domain-containing protein YiiM